MAALQDKLDKANAKITDLEYELDRLRKAYSDEMYRSDVRLQMWSRKGMQAEEAMTRLDATTRELNRVLDRERELQVDYDDLYSRYVRASRILLYKGRQAMRDKIFMQNKKENLFYAFQGFTYIVNQEKEERIRQEQEEMRNAIEFALRNEVRFLLSENTRCNRVCQMLTTEVIKFKKDRRLMAQRIIAKMRPYEELEYFLWIWEMWLPLRPRLKLEKAFEKEQATRDAATQQLIQASGLMLPMTKKCDELRMDLIREQMEHDLTRREFTVAASRQLQVLCTQLRDHRLQELHCLHRIHVMDVEAKEERIAVLEREIAEDKHVHALKGMVIDLESNLRKALDKRKQRGFVVPPGGGIKCTQCGRETMFRGWKCPPETGAAAMTRSASDADLGRATFGGPTLSPILKGKAPQSMSLTDGGRVAWPEKQGSFSPQWH
eukprot:TRINITY_DN6643_c5_g1_i1.p1 TRINITY_DN6643_c5_g1~~TRINITY_DN6643_c5_g1_i1.p1  ORF type:complete len:501 (-),score=102.00 TRINITY_DN6643_c5_g1_i1:157-1461(-)